MNRRTQIRPFNAISSVNQQGDLVCKGNVHCPGDLISEILLCTLCIGMNHWPYQIALLNIRIEYIPGNELIEKFNPILYSNTLDHFTEFKHFIFEWITFTKKNKMKRGIGPGHEFNAPKKILSSVLNSTDNTDPDLISRLINQSIIRILRKTQRIKRGHFDLTSGCDLILEVIIQHQVFFDLQIDKSLGKTSLKLPQSMYDAYEFDFVHRC